MRLKKDPTRDKDEYYLRIVKKFKDNGKSTERTVYRIGYVGINDTSAIEFWEKIVDILNQVEKESKEIEEEIKKDSTEESNRVFLNLGTCFIKQILAFFDYRSVFAPFQRKHNFDFQLYQVYFYLVYSTIIEPVSILRGSELQKYFYEDFGLKPWQLYRGLTYLDKLEEALQKRERKIIFLYFADSTGIFYIDTTNTYTFGGDEPGEGLRQFGYGKDGKKLPLVGIALLCTHNGFPFAIIVYPGNESDTNQLIPLVQKFEFDEEIKRFLLGGDSAFNSGTNNYYLAGKNLPNSMNNGFVFSRSVNQVGKDMREWIYSREGWHYGIDKDWTLDELKKRKEEWEKSDKKQPLYGFDYKVQMEARTIDVWNHDHTKKIKAEQDVRVIACYSDKLRARRLRTIERGVERAQKALNDPNLLDKVLGSSINDYIEIKKTDKEKETDSTKEQEAKFKLNFEKIQEDLKSAGFYFLETSERSTSPETLMHLFKDKSIIESLFRTIKSELHLQPIYVRTPEHIRALIHIRYSSLIVIRALQFCLNSEYSVHEIITSLRKFGCVKDGDEFIIVGRDDLIRDLEDFFGLHFKDRMKGKEIDHLFSYKGMLECCRQPICQFCQDLKYLNLTERDWEELKKHSNIVKSGQN